MYKETIWKQQKNCSGFNAIQHQGNLSPNTRRQLDFSDLILLFLSEKIYNVTISSELEH